MRAVLLIGVCLVGCSRSAPGPLLPESQRVRNAPEALEREFEVSDSLRFRSWNGQWIGTDCDTDIRLDADGGATLTEYGYTTEQFQGVYSVNPRSEVVLQLKSYRGTWPAMALYRDQASLLLAPIEGPHGFVMGDRSAAMVPGGIGAYWPFRLLHERNKAPAPRFLPTAPKLRPVALNDGTLKCYVPDSKGGVASVVSTDRGETWSDPQHEFDLPEKLGLSLSLLDKDGEVHLIFMHGRGEGQPAVTRFIDLWHCRSRNGRTQWEVPQRIWEGYCGAVLDVQQIGDTIVVPFGAWKRNPHDYPPNTGSNYTTAVYSQDGGTTWQLSPSKLMSPCQPGFNGNNYGAIEPTILQLVDRRAWMLMRTQAGTLYESYSKDGLHWSDAKASRFPSSTSPASLVRLPDGAIVLFWNNCEMPLKFEGAGVYGGRDALHAAISRDDGRTWRGFREVYRDPFRNETPPRRGDRGTAYPVAVACRDGSVHLVTGQGNRRTAIRVDPRWLEATEQKDEFAAGLDSWHVWRPFGPASGYWRDRTEGARLVTHPDRPAAKVLQVCKPDDQSPDCATWNFPAGTSGTLTLKLRLNESFQGSVISLTDRFFDPDDQRGQTQSVLTLPISADGRITKDTALTLGQWHKLSISWRLDDLHGYLMIDDKHKLIGDTLSGEVLLKKAPPNGVSYLRLESNAQTVDPAGMLIESVQVQINHEGL